ARLAYAGQSPSRVLRMVDAGPLALSFTETAHIPRLIRIMDKYSNHPMDLADACLVVMAEETRDVMIYTLDREDFSIYRRHGREVVSFISPALEHVAKHGVAQLRLKPRTLRRHNA